MKTLFPCLKNVDKSFLPFILVLGAIIAALVIFWLNFDPSFGGTYR